MAKTKKHLKHNAFDDVEYSFVHRVNPTVKLIVTICFMVMIFSSSSIFVSLILFAFIIFFWFLSHMSAKATFSLFISAIIMFVILALINWITVKEPSLLAINENDNRLILSDSSMFRQINSLAGAEQIVPSQYYYLLNSGFGIDISTYKQPSFIVGNGMDIFALKDHLLRQYPGFNIRLIQVIKGGDWYLYIPYKSE
jgi:energy-coupling factor transporter transmembrane protein EcfT